MDYVIALVPPIGLGVILYVIVRAFLGADRSEREAEKKFREQHSELDLAAFTVDRRPARGREAAERYRATLAEQEGRPAEAADPARETGDEGHAPA